MLIIIGSSFSVRLCCSGRTGEKRRRYMAMEIIIPDSLIELAPSIKENFLSLEASLIVLKDYRLKKLYPASKPLTPRTVFRFQVYQQVILHRVVDLSCSIINCWENKQISSAFVLLRTLNENTSVIYDANKRLNELIEKNDFENIYKLIFNLQYGTRIKERIEQAVYDESKGDDVEDVEKVKLEIKEAYTAQQILTVLDRISKDIPKHREIYEYLCEYAHPNWDGLMGLYCKWENKYTVNISNLNSYNEDTAKNFFRTMDMFLRMFIEGYDGIILKYPELTRLSIEDLKKQGRDTSGYENL